MRLGIKFWVLGIGLFLLLIGGVVAKDQSFSVNYNPSAGGEYEKTIDYSSVMMKVATVEDSICKFDTDSGESYSSMEDVFDETGGKVHRKSFLNLGDGSYRYYVKCKDSGFSGEPEEFKVVIRVNALVTGQILLSEDAPFNTDSVDVRLVTSKIVPQTPSLTYSYDGVSYKPLVLVGSGKVWDGTVVLDKTISEGVLSFKFKGNDLEGRQGTEILSGSYFEFDRVKPALITNIEAVSLEGEIELDWHSDDDDVVEYKIYKSELQNPGYVDYYKTVDESDYTDTAISNGKTYYYRVTAIDEAGNEGDFSREVSGTSLSSNTVVVENGLNPQFFGQVESMLTDVSNMIDEVNSLGDDFDSMETVAKELFETLGLKSKLTKAKSDLEGLKNNIEKYKSQDLTKESLENKLNADRIKLGVIEKEIPSEFFINEESERVEDLNSVKIERALSEINGLLTEKEVDKSIKETSKIIDDDGLTVESSFYIVSISYLGGRDESYSIISRNVVSPFERIEDAYFIEVLPSSISGMENIEVSNRNYETIEEDLVYSFETDTRKIFYFGSESDSLSDLEAIEFSFVKIVRSEGSSSGITGFSVFNLEGNGYLGVLGGIVAFLVLIYFFVIRGNSYSDDYFRVSNRINEALEKIEEKDLEKAKSIYSGVKKIYSGLKKREKKKLYSKIESLLNDILISEIQEDLVRYSETRDKKMLTSIESKILKLPEEKRVKVEPVFEKIKKSFEL